MSSTIIIYVIKFKLLHARCRVARLYRIKVTLGRQHTLALLETIMGHRNFGLEFTYIAHQWVGVCVCIVYSIKRLQKTFTFFTSIPWKVTVVSLKFEYAVTKRRVLGNVYPVALKHIALLNE